MIAHTSVGMIINTPCSVWAKPLEAPDLIVAKRWFRVRSPAGGFYRADVLRLAGRKTSAR